MEDMAGNFTSLKTRYAPNGAPEAILDKLTSLSASLFEADIACVSLIEGKQPWFQSVTGISDRIIDADTSFSAHIIEHGGILHVADAATDPRFADNPLVTGKPHIRFHAGMPLKSPQGDVVGTFWIASSEPRNEFDQTNIEHMQSLSEIVVKQLELRREVAVRAAEKREADFDKRQLERSMALSGTAGFIANLDTDEISWTGAFSQVWGGYSEDEISTMPRTFSKVHPDDLEDAKAAIAAASAPNQGYDSSFRIKTPEGRTKWVHGMGDYYEVDDTRFLSGLSRDITDQISQEKRLRLHTRELHHRLRNLFATLQSIMNLTKGSATSIDDYVEKISGRLSALNRAQQILLDTNFVTGSLSALIRDLCETYPRIARNGPDIIIPENAMVSLSLIFNELATNAAKYGALAAADGHVEIEWSVSGQENSEQVSLVWRETGGLASERPTGTAGFGSSLIEHSVVSNLNGEIDRQWLDDGLTCLITFPLPKEAEVVI